MHTAFNPMGATDMAKDYIIDYGSNSNGWWRKWKSGFIEQFGDKTTSNNVPVVNLPMPFTNINYIVVCTPRLESEVGCSSYNYNLSNFSVRVGGGYGVRWYACGY